MSSFFLISIPVISLLIYLPTVSIVWSKEFGTPCPVSSKHAFNTVYFCSRESNSDSVWRPFSEHTLKIVLSMSAGGSQGLFGRRNLE